MNIEEIIKELRYISGLHPKFIKEEILELLNKLETK